MAMVISSHDTPISKLAFSLQNKHEYANDHMMKFHAMPWWIWKVHVMRRIMQKGALNLELWVKSYGLLKFHAHLTMIGSYLLNHSSDAHDLGLFGNGRERDLQLSCWTKIHLKLLWCWKVKLNVVQKLAIFGNLKL